MKTLNVLHIATVFLLCLSFMSCSDGTSYSGTAEIVPLHKGNTWIYQVHSYDTAGITVETHAFDTVTIGAPTTQNGSTWYPQFQTYDRPTSLSDTLFYRNDTQGFWGHWDLRTANVQPHLIYKFPASQNDTFDVSRSKLSGKPVIQFSFRRVASTLEEVTIPLGRFYCIRYDYHLQFLDSATNTVIQEPIYEKHYVASGIGLIKSTQEYLLHVGPPGQQLFTVNTIERVLQSYKLN